MSLSDGPGIRAQSVERDMIVRLIGRTPDLAEGAVADTRILMASLLDKGLHKHGYRYLVDRIYPEKHLRNLGHFSIVLCQKPVLDLRRKERLDPTLHALLETVEQRVIRKRQELASGQYGKQLIHITGRVVR